MNETPVNQNPYVGLKPFDEENSKYFFGRDRDIRIAANNLRAASITVYYGASGVGKTSLINAGVIPYLRNAATASIPGKKPEFILVLLRDWINDPIESLRNRIKSAVDEAFANIDEKENLTFTEIDIEKEYIKNKDNGNLVQLLKNWNRLTKINFLIILDQFENFLSDTESKPEFKTGKGSFGEEISKVLNATNLPANFMISLRDDALSQMDFLSAKTPDLMKNTLRLEHLDRQSARDAIVKPLAQFNSDNENSSFRITGKLLKYLLEELKVGNINFDANVESDPNQILSDMSIDKIETPFLQLVMNRLWLEIKDEKEKSEQIIKFATLEKFKGAEEPNPVKNIVKTYLDEVMSSFTDAQKIAASKFIHFTVSASGAKRSSTIEDLLKYTDKKVSEADIKTIMKDLAGDRRVFKSVDNPVNPTKPFYEVTHDAIVPAILSWREREYQKIEHQEKLAQEERLRLEQESKLKDQEKRLEEEKKLRLTQEQLLEQEQKNRRLGRRIWYLFSVLALFIIGFLIYGGYNIYKKYEANLIEEEESNKSFAKKSNELIDDRTNLEKEIENYQSIIAILLDLQSKDSKQVDDALFRLTKKAEDGEVPKDYLVQLTRILENEKIVSQDKTKLELTKEVVKKAVEVSSPNTEILKTRAPVIIYIQFQNDDDRSKAVSLRNLINKQDGYLAPGVENVGVKPEIKNIQLRYFRGEEEDAANNVILFLKKNCINAKPIKVDRFGNSSSVRPNQFELWFTSDGIPDMNAVSDGKCSDTNTDSVPAS